MPRPTQILIFSDEFPPSGGGAGVVAAQLASDLTALGCEVHLLTGDEVDQPLAVVSRHMRVHRSRGAWPFSYRVALKDLDLRDFDLIVLNDFVSAYLAGLWFSREALSRCCLVVHGEDGEYVFRKDGLRHRLFAYRSRYLRTLKHCQRIVSVSDYAARLFREAVPVDLGDKLCRCYCGIANIDNGNGSTLTRSALGLGAAATVLLSVGRIVREKGFFRKLTLFEQAVAQGCDYHWFVAGGGPLLEQFHLEVRKSPAAARVHVLGKLPRHELAGYYRLADLFWLLSSAHYETMGLVYLEAASFGLPSLGLRKYGVVEAIAEGRSGLFYEGGALSTAVDECLRSISPVDCTAHAAAFSSRNFAEFLLASALPTSLRTRGLPSS